MLQDRFGRRFYYLRLSVTDICNFRCNYCLPEGYQGRPDEAFLSVDELYNAAYAFSQLGTRKIRLTGGEPALRKDLPEIIERIARIEDIRTLAVTTNGYRLPKLIDDWHRAGLTQLNVSIDSFDANTFKQVTGHDRLHEALAGVERAISLGLKVKVNAVLMRGINDDIQQALEFVKKTPATMRFIEVMETSDQQVFFRQHHLRGQSIKAQLLDKGWQPVLRASEAGPAEEFWHADYQGRLGLIMPYSQDFCASCNRLRISSLGKLHLCLFAEAGIDLRPLLANGSDRAKLVQVIEAHISDKKATHALHENMSGAMKNLSLIGG